MTDDGNDWELKLLIKNYLNTHFSGAPDELEAGLRLLNAFIHLVFIDDELDVDNLRSPGPPIGDPGSVFLIKSSFYKKTRGNIAKYKS